MVQIVEVGLPHMFDEKHPLQCVNSVLPDPSLHLCTWPSSTSSTTSILVDDLFIDK